MPEQVSRQDVFNENIFSAFDELSMKVDQLVKKMAMLTGELKNNNKEIGKAQGFKQYSDTTQKANKKLS